MRAELGALGAVIRLAWGRQGRDRHRVRRLAYVKHPAALDAVGAIVEISLIGEHCEATAGQRQRGMGAAAEWRAPVAVGQELWRGRVTEVVDRKPAVPPRAVGE